MVKGKLLRFFVSCIVVVLVIFPAAALAASGMQDGLQLILTTDKVSYAKNEIITINAAVTNTNSFNITGVKLDISVPTDLTYKTTSPTGSIDLTAGQTADLSAEAVLSSTPDDMPQTGDYAPVELALLLVLLSAGALAYLLILKRKNRASFLSILLCITLMSSSCFLIPSPAYALPAAKSFTVSLPVSVDGENYTLQATLSYSPPAPNPPVLYAVTVNGGTGSGNYAPGATVTITADAPEPGYAFTGWTVVSGGVTLSSASSMAATFTMPASPVEVTATYELITYAVTVNGGTGGGNYAPGATVTITADAPNPGDAFTGWTVVSGGVMLHSAFSMAATFTMPATPVEVTATYELITYAVTVNNGTGSGNYAPGATVTITADAPNPGDTFTGWTVVSGGVTLHSASSTATTFTMPATPVEVTATYALTTYAVTVNGGTGSGNYAPGATVTITADAPDPGYAFTGWTVISGGVTLHSASSTATTFTMPATPVAVTATYELITYAVTVNNGTGGGNYAPGATVTITADAPNPGDTFTGWTVVSGGVTLHSASSTATTFTMPASPVAVTATYALITYAVTVNDGTGGGNYAPGATVSITADAPDPGYVFAGWTVVSGGVTLNSALSAATTFTMPASPVAVTATYELITYAVTVNNGTGGGNYAPGATVSITADAPDPGYSFTGWTVVSGGVTLASDTSAATTFTMPATPVEVTATYVMALNFSSGGNTTMTTLAGGLLNQAAIIGGNGAANTVYTLPLNLAGNTAALAQAQTISQNMILTGWNATFTMVNTQVLIGTNITAYADIYIAPSGSDEFSRAGALTPLTPFFTGPIGNGVSASCSVSGLTVPISAGDRVILVCHCEVTAGMDVSTTFIGTVTAQATLKK